MCNFILWFNIYMNSIWFIANIDAVVLKAVILCGIEKDNGGYVDWVMIVQASKIVFASHMTGIMDTGTVSISNAIFLRLVYLKIQQHTILHVSRENVPSSTEYDNSWIHSAY